MVSWDARWTPGVQTRLRLRDTGRQHLDNTGNARVFVHLRNLGDTEYETWGYWAGENYYTPAAGRNFAVGLDYNF